MDTENGQERRAAVFPMRMRHSQSLGHGIWAKQRLTRGHCAINSGAHERRGKPGDWLVQQAVSSEPVSADFPVKQGKNREIVRISPKKGPNRFDNILISLGILRKFPKKYNREFF